MGLGIVGARRLMDRFQIESEAGKGTTVTMRKIFRKSAPVVAAASIKQIVDELVRQRPDDPFQEIQHQNQELLRALDELRRRQDELTHVNRELEDTNRGVVALYAELDEKADHLRRADELKSRFLSNMSHEFRTPLHSILGLSRLLLDRTDGDLTTEQDKQTRFIQKAAGDLLELVNDLLDLAKIEAGKTVVRPVSFKVAQLFSALRGMLRPLLVNESVHLVFDEPSDLPEMYSDERKTSQILRNFISNALKFTERGEIRVGASVNSNRDQITFSVADTGIGIPAEDQERIFKEFSQLENPIQERVKGTGLGLPLTRKLAEILGGRVSVESRIGSGSTFSVTLPVVYAAADQPVERDQPPPQFDLSLVPVLLVEDDTSDRLLYEKYLKGSPFQVLAARSLTEARRLMSMVRPKVIILDIMLHGEDSWNFLVEVKKDEATKDIPVLVVTSIEDQQKGLSLGADAYQVKPVDRRWLLDQLSRWTQQPPKRLLLVDDEDMSRYVLKGLLDGCGFRILETADPREALRLAGDESPHVILLDLVMPGMTGFEVLEQLKSEPRTASIPVVITTSKTLNEGERHRLAKAAAILSKADLTPQRIVAIIEQTLADVSMATGTLS
jgi:signal transduction histidine kinase/CheY-like chemotaxis protein